MAIHAYIFFSGGACADPDSVMHASLRLADGMLMGSDDPTGDGL
jgi:uncharacterized glyoxalase superfamily protein PhnB